MYQIVACFCHIAERERLDRALFCYIRKFIKQNAKNHAASAIERKVGGMSLGSDLGRGVYESNADGTLKLLDEAKLMGR